MSREQLDERAIFGIARRLDAPQARDEYLQQVCGDNQPLADHVRELLRAAEASESFLEMPAVGVAATIDLAPVSERHGTRIGPYKLLEQIGEGGMGVVYVAEQRQPISRKVALKIIKPGMDTRAVVARFEAERQALALMDHPNIAKVFDAGATEAGRPYFVMELVKGKPITEYCDREQLPMRERLALFVTLCHGVQHAHQKGIIHRDLKPSNILVEVHDVRPVPKIIDFGVAKATGQHLTDLTLHTGFEQMVGTPLYMSPEQAGLSSVDVDTRSDIYSLGVLLYELLTGHTPFEKDTLRTAGADELRRIIREVDPPRPSARVSTLAAAELSTVSDRRHTEPNRLRRQLRGELDWIVMKALEKDRSRRYETASDLARDIQRYLDDEPVEACPPSTTYRLSKFVRRNHTAVLTTAAIGLALILGAGVAGAQAYRATKAERLADEQLQLARQQEQLARKQKKLAEQSAQRERDQRVEAETARKQAESVTDFLVDIFRSPDPERDGRTITVAEMLDKAKTRVETEFKEDPALQGELLKAIGETYRALGLVQEAVDCSQKTYDELRDVLGPRNPVTLSLMENLAEAYLAAGRTEEAITLAQETRGLREEVLGPDHPDTAESMSTLASALCDAGQLESAVRLGEETLRLRQEKLGPEHSQTLSSMNSLAVFYCNAGQIDRSLQLAETVFNITKKKLGPDHPHTLVSTAHLVDLYSMLRPNQAIELSEQLLARSKEQFGPDHPTTLSVTRSVAHAYGRVGRLADSVSLMEELLNTQQEKLGAEHPDTIGSMSTLAVGYWQCHKLDRSVPLFEETLRLQKKVLGENHPNTMMTMVNLGLNYLDAGQLERALALEEEALGKCREHLPTDHFVTLRAMENLAASYFTAGRCDKAQRLWEEVVRANRDKRIMMYLVRAYLRTGQTQRAMSLTDDILQRCRADVGTNPGDSLWVMNKLAVAWWQEHLFGQSIPLFEETLKLHKVALGDDHPETLSIMAQLGRNYVDAGQSDKATPLLEAGLTRCREKLGSGHETTLLTMVNLGHGYTDAGQLEKATPLLEEAQALCKDKLGSEHETTLSAMTVLAMAYGKADRRSEELPLLEKLLELRREKLGPEHAGTLIAMLNLAMARAHGGQLDDAAALLRDVVLGRAKTLGPEHARTLEAKNLLGGIHVQRGDYAEAERLLLEAYQGLEKGRTADATLYSVAQMRSVITNLVQLYEKSNQPDKAAEWKQRLNALNVDNTKNTEE